MSSWTSMFGANVTTKDGSKSTTDALKDKKRVGIYFSAHWCPPCRRFTPMLVQFYEDAKGKDPNGIEIIFVSADSDQGSYDNYYKEMPWISTIYGADCNDGKCFLL